MSFKESSCSTSQEKTDMFVTSLDVFSRRAYFDPYTTHTDVDVLHAIPNLAKAQIGKSPVCVGFHNARKLDGGAEQSVTADESAVSKVKRFSTPSAFTAANSVVDFLKENLGGVVLPEDGVGRDVLFERRRSFFDSLFTIEEDVRTALPCRFSTNKVDSIFRSAADETLSSTESYRKRLAALEHLRTTLDC
ncbi:conserved hypothetical protein [Leishmania infantum JPCM5]|uniref:Uncharacterized protein n=2 Tax=Leishmania infantum TaxID=5671 RepID=E9AHH7_LEIIN|nr:conserved hypothetical protein [Leishmania infantum JPCM5]CAC9502397.1 hypothetical_protein_-_conserved [Leishmania infantum]CBZ08850.1 conserved hypothetical protein [Leishmania infantum JPCM5]SUZ43243.1 hypothetical_protein_-_conserved [Leishmania infantum]|eukprot:XP_003392669.1 conserved hypothetical protein [Leishmania infantum JPCM5]